MKKILIVAAVIAFGAVANAASITWSALANGTKLSNGSVGAGVVAYLFEGALSEAVLSSIANGSWNADASGYLATGVTAANGALMKSGVGSYENTSVNFSMILFDADSYGNATEFKYAEFNNVTFVTANKTANFTSALSAASWQAMSVPEPTSGILMLVGLAGLALRRRCA